MLQIISPKTGETISLQSDTQRRFAEDEPARAAMDGRLTFTWYALTKQGSDNSAPCPVHIRIRDDSTDVSGVYFLLISEQPDLSTPEVYMTDQQEYDLYNLKIDTTYYLCVQKEGERSETVCFHTADQTPRCIYCEGLSNIRDMGGYRVAKGRIRQGLLYRGGEAETHLHPTVKGLEALKRLGIRTEIDMRGEAVGKVAYTAMEPLGIRRCLIPLDPYDELAAPEKRQAGHNFFSVLADRNAYPVYFHCWGGADRTGSFAYLLGALLGMSRHDLIDEYEFTSLSIWGLRSRNYPPFVMLEDLLLQCPGQTLCKKAEYLMLDHFGMSARQIHAIRHILIQPE